MMRQRQAESAASANAKAAQAYRSQCAARAKALEMKITLKQVTTWAGMDIPDIPLVIQAQPFTFMSAKLFLMAWVTAAPERFRLEELVRKDELKDTSTRFVKSASTDTAGVGRFEFMPRQRKAFDACVAKLRDGTTNAVIVPLEGGEGKSIIGWGLVRHWQKNNWFDHPVAKMPLNQAAFTTRASVEISMLRRGRDCDIANLGKTVLVVSHTAWSTKRWAHFFSEEEIESYGNKVRQYVYLLPPPAIIVIDECQDYKKPDSKKSKKMEAIVRKGLEAGSVFIFMSATPWVTVNDTWLFCIATGRKYLGEPITRATFPAFARAIAARAGAKPNENSAEAMAEFRKEFMDCHIIPPRDPKKFKAYNKVTLLEFENDRDRQFYAETMDRYYEELRRCGKGDTSVSPMTAFTKLCMSEEWIKCPYFAKLMHQSIQNGKSAVCGVRSQAALKEIVRLLVHTYGYSRDDISVIWGGSKIITKEYLIAQVGPDLFTNIAGYITRMYKDPKSLTKKQTLGLDKYLKWAREQVSFKEDDDTQAARHAQLMKLRLDRQTLVERQDEMDAFQDGRTKLCVFTLSAGGTGVDLDQQKPHVLPRDVYLTICYWAEEFMQALYRAMRIKTLSNVDQHILFFKDTLVANHTAPRLDAKIKAIRAGVTSGVELADEVIGLLGDGGGTPPLPQLRPDDLVIETPDDDTFDADAALLAAEDDEDEDEELALA
jgi:hypothetical protein